MSPEVLSLLGAILAFLAGSLCALIVAGGVVYVALRVGALKGSEDREAQEKRLRRLEDDLEDARAALLNVANDMRRGARDGGRALTGSDDIPARHGRPPLPADGRDMEIIDSLEGVGGDVREPESSSVG